MQEVTPLPAQREWLYTESVAGTPHATVVESCRVLDEGKQVMDHAVQRLRDPALAALNGVPVNLATWIARSMAGDMGSVGNKEVFRHADVIFMIVKGPNRRNDFHIDPYDEIFYQLKGTIYVKHSPPDTFITHFDIDI